MPSATCIVRFHYGSVRNLMAGLIALIVFAVVAAGVFAGAAFLDRRNARARLLRERLETVQKAADQPSEELALVRDETLSEIPALDTLLRRSVRVSNLQDFMSQAGLK